jgi:hypothetical protein
MLHSNADPASLILDMIESRLDTAKLELFYIVPCSIDSVFVDLR